MTRSRYSCVRKSERSEVTERHMQRVQYYDRINSASPHCPTCTLIRMHISGPDARQFAGGSYCEGKLCEVSRT